MHSSRRSPVAAVLTRDGLLLLIRLAKVTVCAVPLLFILLKMLDRLVRDQNTPWWRDIASGYFGKIDDLSFWVLVSGLLSVLMVCAALGQLLSSRDPTETGWPIRRFHVFAWLAVSLLAICGYLIGIYLTNGTFFIDLARPERIAQVPEGLLNVFMVCFIYFYCVLGIQAARAVCVRLRAVNAPPIEKSTLLAAEYLLNISFSFLLGALLAFLAVYCLQWLGALLYRWTGLGFFDWSMFKPNPLSELVDSLVAVAFITVIFFLPLLAFFPMIRTALPSWVRMRLNLKCRIETLTISAGGLQPIDAKFSPRVLRLVVFTLVELVDSRQAVSSDTNRPVLSKSAASAQRTSSTDQAVVPGDP